MIISLYHYTGRCTMVIVVIMVIMVIMMYIILYNNYHRYPDSIIRSINKDFNYYIEKNIPFILDKNLNIDTIINKQILLNKYGNYIINIVDSFNKLDHDSLPMEKKVTLNYFINNTIINNKDKFYLKSEDEYNFLDEIGLFKTIINCFSTFHPRFTHQQLSFWYGPRDSITPFHYDTDHANLLYIIEGRKRIYLIHPKYNKYMKGNTTIQPGASWSEDTLKDIIQNKNIKYQEIILEKNQLLNIPRYWWHAIINLETTMAVTYHYYTASYFLFNSFL